MRDFKVPGASERKDKKGKTEMEEWRGKKEHRVESLATGQSAELELEV